MVSVVCLLLTVHHYHTEVLDLLVRGMLLEGFVLIYLLILNSCSSCLLLSPLVMDLLASVII